MYNTIKYDAHYGGHQPVATATKIEAGGLVGPNATGYLVNGSDAEFILGRATEDADNATGNDGDLSCEVERGVIGVSNDDTNPVAPANIGTTVYAVAPDVIATAGSTTRAGIYLGNDINGDPMIDTRLSGIIPA